MDEIGELNLSNSTFKGIQLTGKVNTNIFKRKVNSFLGKLEDCVHRRLHDVYKIYIFSHQTLKCAWPRTHTKISK